MAAAYSARSSMLCFQKWQFYSRTKSKQRYTYKDKQDI